MKEIPEGINMSSIFTCACDDDDVYRIGFVYNHHFLCCHWVGCPPTTTTLNCIPGAVGAALLE